MIAPALLSFSQGETPSAADRDEAFVRQACGALGVPLRVFHAAELADTVDAPPPHAGEDWARRLRYACFERLCEEGIDAVATAHTANDQAETLLLRLARGTGLEQLHLMALQNRANLFDIGFHLVVFRF